MLQKISVRPILMVLQRQETTVVSSFKNRWYSSTEANLNPVEKMTRSLKMKFPLAKNIEVVDVSGGCGSMYEIFVESVEFKGLSMVKQHRLINDTLKEDIKQMHGLRIQTKVPEGNS